MDDPLLIIVHTSCLWPEIRWKIYNVLILSVDLIMRIFLGPCRVIKTLFAGGDLVDAIVEKFE